MKRSVIWLVLCIGVAAPLLAQVQGRLRNMKAFGGPSEMLLFSHADEIAQVPKLHLIPVRYWTD